MVALYLDDQQHLVLMRRSFISLYRFIACLLVITVMTSSVAMAAYVCPPLVRAIVHATAQVAEQESRRADMPCAEMDMVKPVHCALLRSGADLALEHLAAAPALAPVVAVTIRPAPRAGAAHLTVFAWTPVGHDVLVDPRYLRTLRLRI